MSLTVKTYATHLCYVYDKGCYICSFIFVFINEIVKLILCPSCNVSMVLIESIKMAATKSLIHFASLYTLPL